MSDNDHEEEKLLLLVSPSRLKKYIKENGMYKLEGIQFETRLGKEFMLELDRYVRMQVDYALRRIRGKKRVTLKPEDLK